MMASLFILLDDIAATLDDVAVMSKLAAKKTAGVLGDDLALNAEQVRGVAAARELPVVWAVAKGSFINKLILVPSALLLSAFFPVAITPLLMLGGAYLCFEGAEKVLHPLLHKETHQHAHEPDNESERDKIKGAVRTDFILSAEIVVISLGVMQGAPFFNQALSLSAIAILMTVGVYGFVALIVKLDDMGFYLQKTRAKWLGDGIIWGAPKMMRVLSILGTAAMFLVGGGIIVHGVHTLHHMRAHFGAFGAVFDFALGFTLGALILALVMLFQKLKKTSTRD